MSAEIWEVCPLNKIILDPERSEIWLPSKASRRFQAGKRASSRGRFRNRQLRPAITSIDVLVSIVLLSLVMSTATSLCFRINQIWKGISNQRVATLELANQLETLTRLQLPELDSALQSLQPSKLCQQSLLDAKLSGFRTTDELGVRISLELQWTGHPGPLKASLSGWLVNPAAVNPAPQSDPLSQPGFDSTPNDEREQP